MLYIAYGKKNNYEMKTEKTLTIDSSYLTEKDLNDLNNEDLGESDSVSIYAPNATEQSKCV